MGTKGDQDINWMQNKTLAESETNGVEVHLFEVFESLKYIYQGVVHLCGKPYQENQKDDSGNMRKVWMFPLSTSKHITVTKSAYDACLETQEKKTKFLNSEELEKKAKEHSTKRAAHRSVVSNTYIRDPYVAEYAKERAHGICQLCGKPAPFNDKDGRPYLESHHIVWLSKGGDDSVENTVALCPNCHRKMHVLNSSADRALLLKKASK
jgi:5-methylcytosine-specific restriction protein A